MKYKMIVFDMDGVLVKESSSWQILHKYFGVDATSNFLAYLEGKINYEEFMYKDTLLWVKARGRPIHRSEIENILLNAKISEKADYAIRKLKNYGLKTMILTSGISILASYVARILNIDYYFANELVFNDQGYLIPGGIANVPLLDKDKILKIIVKRMGYSLDEIVYVGDSIFDIPVFMIVKASIAYTCDLNIARRASENVYCGDLENLVSLIVKKYY